MTIDYVEAQNAWILTTRQTSYVLRVAAPDNWLQHLYWGQKLPRNEDYFAPGMIAPPPVSYSSPNTLVEEFGNQGLLKWREPAIRAIFDDRVRDTVLVYDSFRTGQSTTSLPELIVTMRDNFYPLKVHLHYQVVEDLDLIVRFVEVENTGSTPIRLEQLASAAWHLPVKAETETYRLTHLAGRWGSEFQVRHQQLSEGKTVLESRYGFTSPFANPWFALDGGYNQEYATEEYGSVWYGALAWSGNWKIVIETLISGRTSVVGGLNNFDFEWFLAPGETFTAPAFVAGYTAGGFGQASRNLHRYTLNYVLPRNHVNEVRPVLYNAWEVYTFDVNEQNQMALAEKAAKLGVELFVVDDGWFANGSYARNNDRAGLGDWEINRQKFPNGLKPLIDKVKELGMRFGIWVEPEMVNPQSELYQAHPDWVYHFPHRERTLQRNQLMLNLARADVAEYIFSMLDKLLGANDITFIKWDYNRSITEPGWPDAQPERQREVWVRHVQNLYDILQRLRERYPQVVFESCASGGGRADLGILHYTDQVWTSDNTDAWERLFIQEGYSLAYPIKTMMAWVTDAPNAVSKRSLPVTYRCHSAMSGVMSLGGNLLEWTQVELDETKRLVAEYKQIRQIIQEGELYRLSSPQTGFAAVQYVSRDQRESVVLAFLHSQKFLRSTPRLYLRGLDEKALYRVEGLEQPVSGAALAHIGLKVSLKLDFDSCLVELHRVN